jgi:cyclophilin family peptidyl-prolyl cis-trans isomerase
MGTMIIELFRDLMPNTVYNFINLAESGFYDGLVFHRVINYYVIQGGGYYPDGSFKPSPYGNIDLEINPNLHHYDCAVSMARYNDPNSASSQFFICDGDQRSSLDGEYAVFGYVVWEDRQVVRDLSDVSVGSKYGHNHWPVNDVIIKSITIIDLRLEVTGGIGGITLKVINRGLQDYKKNILFKIIIQTPFRSYLGKPNLYVNFISHNPIASGEEIIFKTIKEKFIFGFYGRFEVNIGIDLDYYYSSEIEILTYGLKIGPIILMTKEF